MTLAPLLAAPVMVQAHAYAALAALALGLVQLARPKGGAGHRLLGRAWVALMAGVAASSFAITGVGGPGHWSWIHLLSGWTLLMLSLGVIAARSGRIAAHRNCMLALFFGALVITGAFTLLPGRIMGAVVFGG